MAKISDNPSENPAINVDMLFYTPSWKDIYTETKNRLETYQESELIDNSLKKAYLDFGYNIIEIPKSGIETRVGFIIKKI